MKVLDFGLVKSVDGGERATRWPPPPGLTPGTPAYMAPEMALGEPVDGRADIYALGCVAYYLLTGQLVFEAENAFQAIARHLNAEPVPPSMRGGGRPARDSTGCPRLPRQEALRPARRRDARQGAGGDPGRALDPGGRGRLVAARRRPGGS